MSILDTIVTHKRAEIAARRMAFPLSLLLLDLEAAPAARDFHAALTNRKRPAPRVIAEIKRRSPSKGVIHPGLDAARTAIVYERNGATAISVLADSRFFGGSLDDLAEVRRAVSLPVLCKEFIVDPYQIYEARAAGADAILLLASVLDPKHLRYFRELAGSLGMSALVEVHDASELQATLDSDAEIVGINNRDLRSFAIDMETTASLLPLVPTEVVVVSESGFRVPADRARMFDIGVDSILVGEGLLTAPDLATATREMCGLSLRHSTAGAY